VESVTHNSRKEKRNGKSTNERGKGGSSSNKIQKINATRVTSMDKKGSIFDQKHETRAEFVASKGIDNFMATHLNKLEKPKIFEVGQQGTVIFQTTFSTGQVQNEGTKMGEFSHLNYHRDPGPTESKFFHGTMFEDRRPVLAQSLILQPKNNGSNSMEIEDFGNAKENEGTSTAERDMEIMAEGVNRPQEGRERENNNY